MIVRWIAANLSSQRPASCRISFDGNALTYVGWHVLTYLSFITIIGWAWVITAVDAMELPQRQRHAARDHLHCDRAGSAVADPGVAVSARRLHHSDPLGDALVRHLVRVAIRTR